MYISLFTTMLDAEYIQKINFFFFLVGGWLFETKSHTVD